MVNQFHFQLFVKGSWEKNIVPTKLKNLHYHTELYFNFLSCIEKLTPQRDVK